MKKKDTDYFSEATKIVKKWPRWKKNVLYSKVLDKKKDKTK
jgi:hypothetical protein